MTTHVIQFRAPVEVGWRADDPRDEMSPDTERVVIVSDRKYACIARVSAYASRVISLDAALDLRSRYGNGNQPWPIGWRWCELPQVT